MSQIYVKIQPVQVIKTIGEIRLYLTSLEFGKSATFSVDSFTTEGELFKRDTVIMKDTDYQNWTNDDGYAISYILTALNYQIATE
jgi:hypothetical protein